MQRQRNYSISKIAFLQENKCMGSDYTRFSYGKRICSNIQVRVDMLDDAIWKDVSNLLSNKERLEEEFKRRLTGLNNDFLFLIADLKANPGAERYGWKQYQH